MAIAGFVAILSFSVAAAAIGWPGLIVVNAVCARFGIYLREFPTWMWLVPGLLSNLFFYTFLFFACAKLWRTLHNNKEASGNGSSPTTSNRRPTTQP